MLLDVFNRKIVNPERAVEAIVNTVKMRENFTVLYSDVGTLMVEIKARKAFTEPDYHSWPELYRVWSWDYAPRNPKVVDAKLNKANIDAYAIIYVPEHIRSIKMVTLAARLIFSEFTLMMLYDKCQLNEFHSRFGYRTKEVYMFTAAYIEFLSGDDADMWNDSTYIAEHIYDGFRMPMSRGMKEMFLTKCDHEINKAQNDAVDDMKDIINRSDYHFSTKWGPMKYYSFMISYVFHGENIPGTKIKAAAESLLNSNNAYSAFDFVVALANAVHYSDSDKESSPKNAAAKKNTKKKGGKSNAIVNG